MNCTQVKEQLVDLLYDELSAEVQQAMDNHLAECSTCRKQWKMLKAGHSLLDRMPKDDSNSRIEVARIYQTVESRCDRSRRCWRAAAAAVGLVAALLVVVIGVQLRFEQHATHVVVAWSDLPEPEPAGRTIADPARPTIADPWPTLNAQQERLEGIDELLKLTAQEVLTVDDSESTELARLIHQFSAAQKQNDQRWKLILAEFARRDRELAEVRLPQLIE
jgi:hypothetical protein